MLRILNLFSLVICLCAWGMYALNDEDYKRALDALKLISRAKNEHRRVFDCKAIGEECTGLVPCCGTTQCYWEGGYDALHVGACVECVAKNKACQRDDQCCGSLQCNKGNAAWMDGKCDIYRRNGTCYRDGQCVNDCVKDHWYSTHGKCT